MRKGPPETVTIPNRHVRPNSLVKRTTLHKERSGYFSDIGTMFILSSERFRRRQVESQTPMLTGSLLYSLNTYSKQENPEEEFTTGIVDATCPDNFVQTCIMLAER